VLSEQMRTNGSWTSLGKRQILQIAILLSMEKKKGERKEGRKK